MESNKFSVEFEQMYPLQFGSEYYLHVTGRFILEVPKVTDDHNISVEFNISGAKKAFELIIAQTPIDLFILPQFCSFVFINKGKTLPSLRFRIIEDQNTIKPEDDRVAQGLMYQIANLKRKKNIG